MAFIIASPESMLRVIRRFSNTFL